jgi:WD40 repeat protein
MGARQLRVYLSSTFEDLKDYRAAVFSALEKAGLAVARMEGYTAADERPLDLCLRDVAHSDVYVGLFAWRYGYIPPPEHGNPHAKSITELEYRQAENRKLRKLLFFAHSDTKANWPEKYNDELSGAGEQGQRIEQLRKEFGTEKSAAFFRTPDDLATQVLAAIMRSGLSGRPNNVPPPPPKFVPRPDLTSVLIDSLIGSSIAGANTVLQGAGGFGKTSLALDACHHPEVINAFSNGILWTSLGGKPDIRQTLTTLCQLVTGDQPSAVDPGILGDTLAQALGGRDYLIVVDDVWHAEDLHYFTRLDGARLLVCTRIRNLIEQAGEVSWPEVSIDEMTAEQAGALLMRGFPDSGPVPAAVQRLGDQLGCWPFLLDLANARLLEERKERDCGLVECADWLAELFRSRGVRDLDRRNPKTRNAAAASSVAISLEFIEESYPGLARKAAEMAIFPEISISALVSLWKIDSRDVEEEVLRPLHNLAIVQWDRRSGDIRLHDVIRLVLKDRLPEAADVHATLIDTWGNLRRLPDSYAWRWVTYHLLHAKRIPQLRALLFDFEWMQAKLAALGVASLIADYHTLPNDRELRLVQRAVQLSADAIVPDTSQLASQLHGRLLDQDMPGIKDLLTSAVSAWKAPWLRPLSASLTRPGGPLIRTLRGHTSLVLAAAVTSDGRRVVSASSDNTLIVWDLARGEVERVLTGHTSDVTANVVTPDCRRVISGSLDATVRVWDLQDGREVFVLAGHTRLIQALAVTPDGKRVISASGDGTLKVWDLVSGALCYTLTGHSGPVSDVKVTSDGRYAVSASEDCTLSVWDLEDGSERHTLGLRNWYIGESITMPDGGTAMYWNDKEVLGLREEDSDRIVQTFAGHVDRVYSVALTPDGRHAVSGSSDGTLRVWDLASGAELHILRGHSNQVAVVVITSNGRRAISGSFDKSVRVWDLETGESLATLVGHAFDVFFVAEIHGGQRVLSASSDNTLKVWDIETGRELGTLRAHTQSIRALLLTPDGRRAISASNDGTLRIWDLDAVANPQAWQGHISPVNAIAVTADGHLAVTAAGEQTGSKARDNTVKIWEIEKAVELGSLEGHGEYIWTVATTPDGRRAVSGAADSDLKVWDLEAGAEIATLRGHTSSVWDVKIAPDGQTAVSAAWDGTLCVWDLERTACRHTLTGHTAPVFKVVICPDGRTAVSTSEDQTVRVWDLEAGTELRTFRGHTASTLAVVVTPDGSRVISGDAAGVLRVWSLETGDELEILRGHSSVVSDLALSLDGRTVVSAPGFKDGSLTVWDLSTGELLQILHGHTAYVTKIAMLENMRAVSISLDRTVRLWNLTTGAMLAIFTGESALRSMAVSPAGTIVVGESSGRVHFLRIEG